MSNYFEVINLLCFIALASAMGHFGWLTGGYLHRDITDAIERIFSKMKTRTKKMSENKSKVEIVDFCKRGSIVSGKVKINVEVDVMVGYSGSNSQLANELLVSQALDQLRSDLLGGSDDE